MHCTVWGRFKEKKFIAICQEVVSIGKTLLSPIPLLLEASFSKCSLLELQFMKKESIISRYLCAFKVILAPHLLSIVLYCAHLFSNSER